MNNVKQLRQRAAGWSAILALAALAACEQPAPEAIPDSRLADVHDLAVFVDMHAHPSRFHRANVEAIGEQEIGYYRRSMMDVVVANISSDMAYDGDYTNRDGTVVEKGRYKPAPGEVYALTADRLARLQRTVELGLAVHADSPAAVLLIQRPGEDLLAELDGLAHVQSLQLGPLSLPDMQRLAFHFEFDAD